MVFFSLTPPSTILKWQGWATTGIPFGIGRKLVNTYNLNLCAQADLSKVNYCSGPLIHIAKVLIVEIILEDRISI
jgi:hypothetical protein